MFTDGNSNMTCAEYYRLHGTLSQERIEYLVNNYDLLLDMCRTILHNSEVIPDPSMKETTDCYSVPIEDIDNLNDIMWDIEKRV